MRPEIQKYIENHINDIDNLDKFFLDCGETLSEEAIGEVIDVLTDSEIETTEARLYALDQYLTRLFKGIRNYESTKAIYLLQFLEDFLQSWMCFDVPRVMDYINDNKDKWSPYVHFYYTTLDYEKWKVKAV